jgi:hypothetical protein
VKSEGMGATTIVVSGSNPSTAHRSAPIPAAGYQQRYTPEYGEPPQGYRQAPGFFPFFNSR